MYIFICLRESIVVMTLFHVVVVIITEMDPCCEEQMKYLFISIWRSLPELKLYIDFLWYIVIVHFGTNRDNKTLCQRVSLTWPLILSRAVYLGLAENSVMDLFPFCFNCCLVCECHDLPLFDSLTLLYISFYFVDKNFLLIPMMLVHSQIPQCGPSWMWIYVNQTILLYSFVMFIY